jgi:hypothetical protein
LVKILKGTICDMGVPAPPTAHGTVTPHAHRGRHFVFRQLRRVPGVSTAEGALRRVLFPRDLRRLHGVLDGTDLAGRYWVWSGLLLGWARERRLLPHDNRDADFAVAAEDLPLFLRAVPQLEKAGYRRLFRYTNNAGRVTEYSFIRHGAKFEFFVMEPFGSSWRYHLYGDTPSGAVEMEAYLPRQGLAPFGFLRRTWLKSEDHDAELTAMYGDWRTPVVDWCFLDELTVVATRRWKATDYRWPPDGARKRRLKVSLPSTQGVAP